MPWRKWGAGPGGGQHSRPRCPRTSKRSTGTVPGVGRGWEPPTLFPGLLSPENPFRGAPSRTRSSPSLLSERGAPWMAATAVSTSAPSLSLLLEEEEEGRKEEKAQARGAGLRQGQAGAGMEVPGAMPWSLGRKGPPEKAGGGGLSLPPPAEPGIPLPGKDWRRAAEGYSEAHCSYLHCREVQTVPPPATGQRTQNQPHQKHGQAGAETTSAGLGSPVRMGLLLVSSQNWN